MKKLISLALAAAMTLALAGCGGSKGTSSGNKTEDGDQTVYKIGVVQDMDTDYANEITQGFQDALTDKLGEEHVYVTKQIASQDKDAGTIINDYISGGMKLIMANGQNALSTASIVTDQLPIVGTNVVNFQDTLHILTSGDSSWNKKTGRNITGIQSAPNMLRTLSILIEATPNLETVGILYSPEDKNAIFLNERLEGYLDEAGIPWKEYEVPSTASAIAQEHAASDSADAIRPNKKVCISSKLGSDMDVQSIGETTPLSGINIEVSARTAKISKFWYGPRGTAKPEGFTTNEADQTPYLTALPADAGAEEVVQYAANESSVLYVSSESMLTDQAQMIGQTAQTAGISSVAGDMTAGRYMLVTLFTDPYNQGYEAGRKAAKILADGENPGEIEVDSVDADAVQKLYNPEYAKALGMTFPKSFADITTYRDSYDPAQFTTRKPVSEEK